MLSAVFSRAAMGPYKAVGGILLANNGPIPCYRQLFSWAEMGPDNAIGSIQCYRQLFSWAEMGPYNAIGSFSDGQQWAHTRISPAFLMGSNGPIQCYRQLF